MGAHHITIAERYTIREEIKKLSSRRLLHTSDYLTMIRLPEIAPTTSPFDPGYDPATLESHLEQSAHLLSILKISRLARLSLRRPPRAKRWPRGADCPRNQGRLGKDQITPGQRQSERS